MKITIESTQLLTTIDGIPVRAWRGVTERGVLCTVLVHRLVVQEGEHEQFQAELAECGEPSELRSVALPRVIDPRHIL